MAVTTLEVGPWPTQAAVNDLRHNVLDASDLVIIEDWALRANMADILVGQKLPGPEAKGYVIGYCLTEGIPVYIQQPADIYNMEAYVKEKAEFWPASDHEQDALKHLYVWLMRQTKKGKK
jgi:hypothetical protein